MALTVLDDLLASLPADPVPVRHVIVGAHWTVVCSRHAGMAAALGSDGRHTRMQPEGIATFASKPAQGLAELARSDDLLEASLGVAAINSLLDLDEAGARELNAADELASRGEGKRVAVVGRFPFVEELRGRVGELWVIEQRPIAGDYPAEAASDLLPRAEVVAITGSALINHTLDGLLALCAPGASVMVLGPSTPLSPVLFDHGADLLSGLRVHDEEAVLRTVREGTSLRQIEGVKLLTISRPGVG